MWVIWFRCCKKARVRLVSQPRTMYRASSKTYVDLVDRVTGRSRVVSAAGGISRADRPIGLLDEEWWLEYSRCRSS